MKKTIRYLAAVLLACAFVSGAWAGKLKEPIKYLEPVYKTDGVAASGIDHWVTNNVPDGYTIVTSSLERVTWNEGWYVVTGNVVLLEQGAECKGAVHLVLADGCKLNANGGEDEYCAKGAAICVTGSKNALTIYGGADGSGMLDAQGGEECGAGIGGNHGEEGRNITINGGKVTARGWSDAAGIGGGFENGRDILINGGEVTVYGGSGSAAIGGGTANNGTNIRINGGIVKAFAGGGWADPLPCGIGSGDGMDGSGDIYIADGLLVKAGTSDPPTDVVAHASPATDVTEQLSGKRYVTIEPAPPLPPVASVTIDGVTTLYGDIVSAWNAAKAGTIACPATLKLLKDVTVDTMLAVNIYNSSIVVDLNDKVMKGTMANGSVIYNENAVGALSVVDTSVARTPKYFVRQDDGLWTLTNDVTDLSVTGGVLTGGKASGVMCYSPLALTNVNFVGNEATGGGGAVYGYKDFAAARCAFLGNVAALEGGAVFSRGNYDLSDCQIEGNVAGKAGGGIYSYAHGTLVRTTIIGNRTSTTGGGVEVTLNVGEGCFAAGTKILMADGSEKNVEEIVEGERVATFDHEGGTNSSAAVCLAYAGEGMLPAVTLSFLSGAKLTIVDRHDLLAQTTRKYVTLTTENAADFLGTRFYNYRTASWDELVGVEDAGRRTSFHSVYTTRHVNCVANGLLTVADDNDFVLNVYELDEGLKADAEQLAADVAVYGLFDYAEYPQTAGYEEFYDSLNMQYLYVAIGKGLVTWDYVWELGAETVLEPQESVIEPKLMMSAPRAMSGMPTPVALPEDPYLAVGSNVVITGNVSAVGIDNVYLDRSGDALIAILADAADLDIGVTLSTGAGMFGWTNHVDHASAFTSDDANYGVAYTADNVLELVPFITVVPAAVEHATAAVYDGETKLVDEPYVVLSNATEVTVVYVAEEGYYFKGGVKVITNQFDTSKNPAVNLDPAPTVLEPIEYCEPVYVGGVASNGIERWETKTCWNYTVVTSEAETVTWGERESTNWYAVVDADVEIGGAAECFGHVKLILCKGAKLSVTNNEHESGIWTDVEGSFTVYGQPDGAGELIAAGGGQSAGIGGDGDDGRNITINGGTITATGGRYGGAGIGGGTARDGNGLVVNGGTVTAIGRRGGTGIGGGAAGGGLKGAFMDKRRTRGVGSEITINGGTVTAIGSCGAAAIGGGSGEGGVDMPGLLTFMPTGGAPGVDIAINGGTLYLASPITDNRGEIQCGELIGGGYSSEIESSGVRVSDRAKVFFNLTGCINHRDEEEESVAAMPTEFAGFVAMTPATQTVDRVLIGGLSTSQPLNLSTLSLTNAATAATDAIAVNAERHIPFASTFLRLTYADEKLTLKVDPPELTISQQPEVANGYAIVAFTDGNEDITNYAWGVKTERSLDFVALTNENLLCWTCDCHVEDDAIVSDGGYMGDCLDLGWYVSELPRNGRFRFSCPVLLTLEDRSQGTLTRDGEEYVFTPAVSEDNVGFYVTAEETIVVSGLVYEYVEFDVKSEGEDMTAFPPEAGETGSQYVCRVTYGHNGRFYIGDSEAFTYVGVITVVYKAEGGAWSDGLAVSNVVTLISGGYAFPEAPVREGSNFIGWFDGATNGAPQVAEAQELLRLEEHALHAKWESVTIDPEGGEDALAGGEASSGRKDETAITGGKKSVTDADGLFVVPDVISNGSDGRYVTEIGKGAFAAANYSFGKIKALITPRYLTRICAGAFYQQRELRSLAIAASVDYNDTEKPVKIVIERQAFAGTALETVLIPSNVVEIVDNAFLNCAELAKIVILGDGANLKTGAAAFARCGEASEDGITVYVSPEFLANHPTFAADVAAANPAANVQVTTASPATSAAIGELQVGENGMVALVVSTTVEVPGTLPDVAKVRLMHSVDLSVFGEVTEDVVKTAFADGTVLIEFPKPEGASGYWKIEIR